jgi:hypothetical protein
MGDLLGNKKLKGKVGLLNEFSDTLALIMAFNGDDPTRITDKTFNKRKAEAAEHRERFTEALRTIVGERLRPVYVLLDGESVPEPEEQLDEEELLERIKSEFDAEEVEGKA